MNDVVKGWNVSSISRTCCGLSREMNSGKDLQTPLIIPVSDRNTDQIVLVKHFLYYLVVEPDDRGLLVYLWLRCLLRNLSLSVSINDQYIPPATIILKAATTKQESETNYEINMRSPYGAT